MIKHTQQSKFKLKAQTYSNQTPAASLHDKWNHST